MSIKHTKWENRGTMFVLVKISKKHGGHLKVLALILPDRSAPGCYQALLPGVGEILDQDSDIGTLKNKVEELLLEQGRQRGVSGFKYEPDEEQEVNHE